MVMIYVALVVTVIVSVAAGITLRRRRTALTRALIAIAFVFVVVVVATVRAHIVEGRGVLAECGAGPSGQLVVRLDGTDFEVVSLPWGYLYDHAEHVVMVSRRNAHPESYDGSYDGVAHLGDPVIVRGTTLDGYGDPPPCSDVRYIRIESIVPA